MQKTPIILSKPPAERVSRENDGKGRLGAIIGQGSLPLTGIFSLPQSKQPPPPAAPAAPPAPAPLEKPIVLMKPREEGKGPATPTNASTPEGTTPPPPAAPVPPKGEKEGQRPTQPVYQIQNRGMGTAAPAVMDRELGPNGVWLAAETPSHRRTLPESSVLLCARSRRGPGQTAAPGAHEAQHQAGGRPDELVRQCH